MDELRCCKNSCTKERGMLVALSFRVALRGGQGKVWRGGGWGCEWCGSKGCGRTPARHRNNAEFCARVGIAGLAVEGEVPHGGVQVM